MLKEAVVGIRKVRTDMGVAPSRRAAVYCVSADPGVRRIFEEGRVFFTTLAQASGLDIQADKTGIAEDSVSVVTADATLYIPLSDLVDIGAEIERLTKEEQRLLGELKRSEGMLKNERFLAKAPESKVAEEKEKQARYEQQLAGVRERLGQLKK